MFCCLWNPSHGVKFNTSLLANGSSNGSASCACQQTENSNDQVQVSLSYRTAEYQAKNPSNDRSLNIVKATDSGVEPPRPAVEQLRTSLCQHILVQVTSTNSSDEVCAIVKSAFYRSDEELKQSLLALPPNIYMS
ncbi:unnamed protein product [Peronospora destructor]|uniref:Uncharacterized protein n=1 Tax=Peronospora destructor TaxID=86335 RepID=A0AAV0US80_9STRA|nr:unnamed protein product [Peronospora destructor]